MAGAVLGNRIYMTNTPELEEKLVKELTYKIPPRIPRGFPTFLKTYLRIGKDIIAVPSARTDLIPDDYSIKDNLNDIPVELPDITDTLRDSQLEVYNGTVGDCLVNAKPGWGKTYTAIALAQKLGQKTLVIVHTQALADQWVAEVEKVCGFTPGKIWQGKFDLSPAITIGIVKSVNSKITKLSKKFGTVIVDECHRCPTTIFLNSLNNMRQRYTIGLSATPKRKDGKHIILPDFFGSTKFQPLDENRLEPSVVVINYPGPIPGTGSTPWVTRLTRLYEDEAFCSLIGQVCETQAAKGHKVLCVSNRIEFLDKMADNTPKSVALHSKSSNTKRAIFDTLKNGENNILYAGVGSVGEGVSENYLSCLVLAVPLNNEYALEQIVGRIQRKYPNKLDPVVIDFRFTGSTGKKQFYTRKGFYVSQGWKVTELK